MCLMLFCEFSGGAARLHLLSLQAVHGSCVHRCAAGRPRYLRVSVLQKPHTKVLELGPMPGHDERWVLGQNLLQKVFVLMQLIKSGLISPADREPLGDPVAFRQHCAEGVT